MVCSPAYWLARAEIEGKLNKTLIELAQRDNPDLNSLLEASQKLESDLSETYKILHRVGLNPSRVYPTRNNCECFKAGPGQQSVVRGLQPTPGAGTPGYGSGGGPGSVSRGPPTLIISLNIAFRDRSNPRLSFH